MNNQNKHNILRLKHAAEYLGVSTPTLWRLEKTPEFPSKIRITSRCVGYLKSDLDKWIESSKLSVIKKADATNDSSDDVFLSLQQTWEYIGVSKSSLRRLMLGCNNFPERCKTANNRFAYKKKEIDDWLDFRETLIANKNLY